ncbi:MAG: hypothetical protein KG003_07930 [Bacteroidetes bacterium]|nr:hypothetical protein [Bacteroidota bacterium]
MISAKNTIFGLIFISSYGLIAQSNHQVGVNGTQFFKQFVAQNNSTLVENNPYLLTYRYHAKKINFRAGLGGNYSFSNDENGANQFRQETSNKSYALRLGVDKTRQLSKRWYIYYGADLFSTSANKETKTFPNGGQFVQTTVVTQQFKSMGVAGVLTLEFRINDKITLFTEANLNWNRSSSKDAVENPDFPDSSVVNKSKSGGMSYSTPLSLFFSFFL